ncbi:MAG: hypothetical protein O3A92_06325 [Verrucomicrobia bacterium]|nr:hypothetical protein [Verrucomicrobiota bacterium]
MAEGHGEIKANAGVGEASGGQKTAGRLLSLVGLVMFIGAGAALSVNIVWFIVLSAKEGSLEWGELWRWLGYVAAIGVVMLVASLMRTAGWVMAGTGQQLQLKRWLIGAIGRDPAVVMGAVLLFATLQIGVMFDDWRAAVIVGGIGFVFGMIALVCHWWMRSHEERT